eukprot:GHRQ01034408.1.p1 GENE.GHRQ01034408.1~~GHRQ01034408.1.p1  ORF type:complete len:119 (+),score=34.35 GHRQ01034408.1:273-629(+)
MNQQPLRSRIRQPLLLLLLLEAHRVYCLCSAADCCCQQVGDVEVALTAGGLANAHSLVSKLVNTTAAADAARGSGNSTRGNGKVSQGGEEVLQGQTISVLHLGQCREDAEHNLVMSNV